MHIPPNNSKVVATVISELTNNSFEIVILRFTEGDAFPMLKIGGIYEVFITETLSINKPIIGQIIEVNLEVVGDFYIRRVLGSSIKIGEQF